MDKVVLSGSHSSEYGKETLYMSPRIDQVPYTDDHRNERRGNSAGVLVGKLRSGASDMKSKFVNRRNANKAENKSKEWEEEPGDAQSSQSDSNDHIAELPASDVDVEAPQSASLPSVPPAELEGDNIRSNCGRGSTAEGVVDHNNCLDLEGNSSAAAEGSLALVYSKEPIPELPSNTSYRRTLLAPSDRVGKPSESLRTVSGTDPTNELTRIQNELLRAMIRFPELRESDTEARFESTENSIVRIFAEYGRMRDSNNRTKKEYAENFLRQQNDLRAANTKLRDKVDSRMRELEEQKSRHGQETERLKREISSLKYQKRTLEDSHGNRLRKEKRSLQNEIDNLESKLRMAQGDAESDRRDLGRRLDKAIKTIDDNKAKWLKERSSWQQNQTKLEDANADLESRLRRAEYDEQKRVEAVEDKWTGRLVQERRGHEDALKTLHCEMNRVKSELEREGSRHQEELRKQEEVLLKRYEAKEKELETALEKYRSSSARREHFKGMTDGQVAAQYKRLANSIDEFSRIEWERAKEHTWPISDDHMRKLARNTRKLKQHIIQNTLWLLLYHHIFQSPFKILGTFGEQDDMMWIPIYSSGASSYEWPDISSEAERNRFETAKAAVDALAPSASHSTLKSSFEVSVANTMDVICQTLLKVATIQDKDLISLENIILLAGRVWVESCSQRYRLIVILPYGSGDILQYVASNHDTLQLVIRPDLKRYGDSQGKGLLRGEPLASWKAQIETYPQ